MEETCVVKKHYTFTAKEVLLCGGRNKRVIKYGCFFNPRSYGKLT